MTFLTYYIMGFITCKMAKIITILAIMFLGTD